VTAPDLIFVGSNIYTADGGRPRAEAVAVAGERLLAVGRRDDVLALRGPRSEVVDLRKRALLPGFYDAHQHQLYAGLADAQVDARAASIEELIERIRIRAAVRPQGTWVEAAGYDETRFAERRHPTRDDLDRASARHPVLVTRTCGHVMALNSRALAEARVDRATPDPDGGRIDRAQDTGEPTGVVRERAMELVRRVVDQPGSAALTQAILDAAAVNLRLGITSVWEPSVEPAHITAYERLDAEGRLPLRVTMAQKKVLRSGEAVALAPPFRRSRLSLVAVKLFQDGALAPRTAALSEPYPGEDENRGLLYWPQEELDSLVEEAHSGGFQVSIHAIGDAAISSALEAIRRAVAARPAPATRHRIEHCGLPLPDLHDRLRKSGVVAVVQPGFLHFHGDVYAANVDGERARWLYPIRTLLALCRGVAGSSDAPVIPDRSPLFGMAAAMTRRTSSGAVLCADEQLGFDEALRLYTTGPAFAAAEDADKGSLAAGKLADLVVLADDPGDVPGEELSSLAVEMTFVGGRLAWSPAGGEGRG
jgi:predicted amidohydrolase YtcJ